MRKLKVNINIKDHRPKMLVSPWRVARRKRVLSTPRTLLELLGNTWTLTSVPIEILSRPALEMTAGPSDIKETARVMINVKVCGGIMV